MSGKLPPGLYEIRYVPPGMRPPFFGGVYAAGEDINRPVQALPNVPPFSGVRVWQVDHFPPNKEQYTISTPGFKSPSIFQGVGPVLGGWGRPPRKRFPREGLEPDALHAADVKADQEAEEEGLLPPPDLPVLFTTSIKHWNITEDRDPSGDPQKTVWTITVPTKLIGVTSVVGVDRNHLTVKNYPVAPPFHPFPAWQFIPVERN